MTERISAIPGLVEHPTRLRYQTVRSKSLGKFGIAASRFNAYGVQ
jgi:hypothetical protein